MKQTNNQKNIHQDCGNDCHVNKMKSHESTTTTTTTKNTIKAVYTVDINNNIISEHKNDEYLDKKLTLNRTISTTSTASSTSNIEEYCYIDNKILLKLWQLSREARGIGLLFAFLSVICWSGNSLSYKLINDRLEPLVMFTFTSLFVALFYLSLIIIFYKPNKNYQNPVSNKIEILNRLSILFGMPGERIHLISRCILGTISQGTLYTSYKYIPMADATTIRFTSPIFIAIFAHFLIDEPFGMLQIINVITTLIGVILVGRPSFLFGNFHDYSSEISSNTFNNVTSQQILHLDTFDSTTEFGDFKDTQQIYGLILALIAALSISVSMISVRKLKATPAALVIFWFSMSNVILGAGTVILMGHSFTIDWTMPVFAFFIVISFGTTLDQLCITMALKLENAGAVAVIQALCVLFSFILSITVVGEKIHITSAFGGALIFLSVIILAGAKWYNEIDAYSKFGSRASLNTTLSSTSSIDHHPHHHHHHHHHHHFDGNINQYVHNQSNRSHNQKQSNDHTNFVPIGTNDLKIDSNRILTNNKQNNLFRI